MSYTPPAGSVDVSWVGKLGYQAPSYRVAAVWSVGANQWVLPFGAKAVVSSPVVLQAQQLVSAPGIESGSTGVVYVLRDTKQVYRPPQFIASASWVGADPYGKASGVFIRASWDRSRLTLAPGGINDSVVSEPAVFGTQFLQPNGWSALGVAGKHYALFPFEYAFPQWELNVTWVGRDTYVAASGVPVNAAWALPSESKQVSLTGWDDLSFGLASLERRLGIISPPAIGPEPLPAPSLRNAATPINPAGLSALTVGAALIYNYRQYLKPAAYNSALYGVAYLLGGKKTIQLAGIAPPPIGAVVVINTTANQTAKPGSIAWAGMGAPSVSPRTVRPSGYFGTTFSFPRVQFPPQPRGWQSSTFGYAQIEYKTKILKPAGIDSYAAAFPVVRDRAQKLLHKASTVTAIFGDVQIRVLNQRVQVPAIDSLFISEWAEVRSNRRSLLVIGSAYGAVGGAEIRNKTPSFTPHGWSSLVFGGADVGWRVRSVAPSGVILPFPQIPLPSLWQTPSLNPGGIASHPVPGPTVWPAIREVVEKGWDSLKVGSPTIDFNFRKVVAEGRGIAGGSYGTARVELSTRLLRPLGREYLAFGVSWLSTGEQFVTPNGIASPLLSLHRIGGTQFLGPEGFEATRWLTRITPPAREIYPKTFGASYGLAKIEHYTRYIPLFGITTYPEASMHWGVARVWNRVQVITQFEDQQSDLWPPEWPRWTLIQNRNKTFGVAGFDASRTPQPVIANTGRPIFTAGIKPPSTLGFYRAGSVTHRVRYLPLEGLEPPLISRWHVAYNKAAPLLPAGLVATRYGDAQVVNTRRFYKAQGANSFESGYPFISDAIRHLTFESRYGIAPPVIELPKVGLYTRYIEPASLPETAVGAHALDIFFRRITPRWTHQDRSGSAFVRNKTPELRTKGRATDEYGSAEVRLEWRPLDQKGASTQLFGSARISDRRQVVDVAGRNFMNIGDKITVRRVGAEPVITQYIDLRVFTLTTDGDWLEADDGYGIKAPNPAVGEPDLSKGYIFHKSGGNLGYFTLFGNPTAVANTIRVEPGYGELLVGEPFLALKVREVAAEPLEGVEIKMGKPRLSPHTIYAVLEATDQAIRNHEINKNILRPVNEGVRLGRPSVSTYLGTIEPVSIGPVGPFGNWGVGRPNTYNTRRYLMATGASMTRMGWVVVPGSRTVLIEDSIDSIEFGRPAVAPPPYIGPKTARVSGIAPPALSRQAIEYFNRSVYPAGFYSQAMGASGKDSLKYMPQNLHVGPLRPTIPGGFSASSYGTAWVSRRVREVVAQGFDSFLSEYDFQNFKQRMRVTRTTVNEKPRQTVMPYGFVALEQSVPDVKHGTHYIRPDGNADQYRKGAF